MIYAYECSSCHREESIIKTLKEIDREERCFDCKGVMERQIVACQFNIPKLDAHHNYAFGKIIHNRRELDETLKRHNGEKGTNLVEVGTDNLSSVQKKKSVWTDEESRQMKEIIDQHA